MIKIPLSPARLCLWALIDEADGPAINPHWWHAVVRRHKNGRVTKYAGRWDIRSGIRQRVLMHIDLLGYKEGHEVDHRDGDGLNNRRKNLRHATKAQNQANAPLRRDSTSGYKGVSYEPQTRGKKWRATIQHNKKRIVIGRFATAREAAKAYDYSAITLFGEFAKPNFPSGAKD